MNPRLRNILAVIGGWIIGSVVNMFIVSISGDVIPTPEGFDMTTPEGLKGAMEVMETKHFIMPFLAHALGTLVAAFLAVKLSTSKKLYFALIIGTLFFVGGVMVSQMIGAPFNATAIDLLFAYLPMAWIGYKLGK